MVTIYSVFQIILAFYTHGTTNINFVAYIQHMKKHSYVHSSVCILENIFRDQLYEITIYEIIPVYIAMQAKNFHCTISTHFND